MRIHGICDGLLCISADRISYYRYCVGDNIFLWNPFCRKAKKLPELKITEECDGFVRKGGVTFGHYDNDYKVIVISCVDCKYIVSVYGLSSNCWNIIHTNSYYDHKIEGFCVMQPTRLVDGIAYMMIDIFRRTRATYEIPIPPLTVCFDLRDETIQQFRCPDEFLRYGTEYSMEAYGKTIAVVGCDNKTKYLAMWILYRDKFSSRALWEKKNVMKLDLDYSDPVGFLYNDIYMVRTEFILPDGQQTLFFLYNLESREVTEHSSPEGYSDDLCRIESDCVGSLILLDEDGVYPFVHSKEMKSSCTSALHNALYKTSRKRKK